MCLKLYMYVCWAVWIYVYRVDFVKVFSLDSPSVSNALHPLDTHSIPMGVSREGCYVYKNYRSNNKDMFLLVIWYGKNVAYLTSY